MFRHTSANQQIILALFNPLYAYKVISVPRVSTDRGCPISESQD